MDSTTLKWKRFIEPITIFIMFSYTVFDAVITDNIIYKTCVQRFNKNDTDCTILYKNSSSQTSMDLNNKIQEDLADILSLKMMIETFLPTLAILFAGSWSDTNGRKPLLIVPLIGSIIYYVLFSLLSIFDNVDPYWFLLPSTISAILGGFPIILMTCFCYVTDVTSEQNRAWRLGFLDFILFGGQLIGYIVGPILFKQFGYSLTFAVSAISCIFGLFYTIFCLSETKYIGTGRSLKTLFSIESIKDLYLFLTQKRENFDRCLIWCCLLIISLHNDMMQGMSSVLFLFTKLKFGWSVTDYSNYLIFQLIITMAGMLLFLKLMLPFLRLPETISVMIASLSNGAGSMTKALSRESWHIYLSSCIGVFGLAPASLVRSIISKNVRTAEHGKAFAVTTAMEKLGPTVTTPIFFYVYQKFLKYHPTPVFFFTNWYEFDDRRFDRNR